MNFGKRLDFGRWLQFSLLGDLLPFYTARELRVPSGSYLGSAKRVSCGDTPIRSGGI